MKKVAGQARGGSRCELFEVPTERLEDHCERVPCRGGHRIGEGEMAAPRDPRQRLLGQDDSVCCSGRGKRFLAVTTCHGGSRSWGGELPVDGAGEPERGAAVGLEGLE